MNPFMNMNNYNQQQMNMMMTHFMMNMMNNNMMGMGNNNMMGMFNNNMMGMNNNMNDMFMMFQKWYQANFANNNNNKKNIVLPCMDSKNVNKNKNNKYEIIADQAPKGILESGKKYLQFKVDDCDIRNIKFRASSGLNVMISINKNKPLKDLFIEYAKRVGFPEFHLGKEIVFLFNALTIDVNDDKNTINSLFPKDSITITVIDQNEIIGAINQNKVKKN